MSTTTVSAPESTTALVQSTVPGTRCVTIVGVPSSCGYPITVCRVYVAVARRDGVVTWRPVAGTDRHRTSHSVKAGISAVQEARAEAYAAELGVRYAAGVRLGRACR